MLLDLSKYLIGMRQFDGNLCRHEFCAAHGEPDFSESAPPQKLVKLITGYRLVALLVWSVAHITFSRWKSAALIPL